MAFAASSPAAAPAAAVFTRRFFGVRGATQNKVTGGGKGGIPSGLQLTTGTQLTIKGLGLEALGFRTGQPVIVTAEKGRLTIELEFKF